MNTDPLFSCAGKVALITGAARGLGREFAEGFAARNANVIATDIDGEELTRMAEGIAKSGGQCLAVPGDVSTAGDVQRVVKAGLERFKRIDILVNNAGICQNKAFLDLTEADWDRTMAVNVKGAFLYTQAVLPGMMERGFGRIIMISSLSGRSGGVNVSASYSASKAALMGLAKGVARDAAPKGVTVNIIAPGATDTALYANWPEAMKQGIRDKIPARRFAETSDILGAVLFLASDGAAYVTGATIDVNGGLLIV